MDTIFSHASAYEALNALRADPGKRPRCFRWVPTDPADRLDPLPLERMPPAQLEPGAPDTASVDMAATAFGVRLPAHVLVGLGTPRRSTSRRIPHAVSVQLAAGSLVRLSERALSVSPEQLFLQMARRLDRLDLVWLGCELCAVYALGRDPRGAPGSKAGAAVPSWPLTCRAMLEGHLRRAKASGLAGAKAALAALPHVLDGAASPAEVELALAMTLPRAMGGHAVPKPRLNCPVRTRRGPAGGRGAPPGAEPHFTCDECWPERRLAVEYDSDLFHDNPRKRAYDNDRRAALEDVGYRVISISTEQLDSLILSEAAFRRVAAHLGARDRERELAYDWQARRWELRRRLHRLATGGIVLPQ